MSANTIDDSDTEGNVVHNVAEQSGGDPLLPYHITDTGSSITQRCRKRHEWVTGAEFPGGNKDDWVCQDENCARPVCAAYHAYEIDVSELEQSRQELTQSRQELAQSHQELAQSRQELDRDIGGPNSQPSENQNKILRLLQGTVKDKSRIVKDNCRLVKETKERLKGLCENLTNVHLTMKEVLINGKAAGNKTDHNTLYTNKSGIEEELGEMDEADAGNRRPQTSPSHLFNAMHDRIENYAIPASLDEIVEDDLRRAEIEAFYGYCDSLFLSSIESEHTYMSEEYAKDIQVTVTAIVEWKMDNRRVSRRTATVYRPSSQAQETRGVHPILLALMWKINSILKGSAHLTSEQYLSKQLEKSNRRMDAPLWSKAAQHFLPSANGNLIGKSCQIKPISRRGEGHDYKKMVSKGINQELGHSLQVLWDSCYQFCGGLGKDGETSGIVLTMISASLLGSKLSGVGTKDVKLKIIHKEHMPLFSEQTTQNLANGVPFDSLGLAISPKLMQPGFVALIDYILNEGTPQDTMDLSLSITDISADVTEYLGSGAFCSVYKCSLSDGTHTVLKMSKHWDSTTLDSELEALKELSHEAIPKLHKEHLVNVTVKARCELKQFKGLLLDLAIGVSLKQKPEHVRVQEVYTAMEKVLVYAHGKSWFHLDIQPANILVVANDDGTYRYILIDWGMAVKGTKALSSFRGSPPFSHPDMLLVKKEKGDKWCGPRPKAEFDRFSLAMTLAYIEHNGVPWSGFHNKVVTDYMLEDRYEKAVNLINASKLEDKKKVLGWIPKPAKQSPSSQPETPTGRATKGGRGRKRKSNSD